MNVSLIADSENWHRQRSRVIGGSEVAALFGVQPDYMLSHYGLWMVKSGRAPRPEVNNPRTRWGIALEEVIGMACAEQEGWTISKGTHVVDPSTPGLGCTLDYVIEAGEVDQNGLGALELKNVDYLVHKRAWTDGEPPLHILLQHQHQLAATGYSWGAVACLVGGNTLEIHRYAARPRLIADIRRRVSEFWNSIDEGRPPPVDGSDSTSAILRAMNLPMTEEVADLQADNELPEICAGLLHATNARKAADKIETEFKNRLTEKMGCHLKARAQGYFISTSLIKAKDDRTANPGEVIRGRAESRRTTVKELAQ